MDFDKGKIISFFVVLFQKSPVGKFGVPAREEAFKLATQNGERRLSLFVVCPMRSYGELRGIESGKMREAVAAQEMS